MAEPEAETTVNYPSTEPELQDNAMAEPTAETEPIPLPEPDAWEMIVPPVAIWGICLCVVLVFYIYSHRRLIFPAKYASKTTDFPAITRIVNNFHIEEPSKLTSTILTHNDRMTLQNLKSFQNNIHGLLGIGIAPSLSLLLCPLTLYLYTPISNFCWPKELFSTPPNINDAIACFLVPAGMVYAFMFGFALQQVYGQYCDTEERLNAEVEAVHDTVSLVSMMQGVPNQDFMKVLVILKDQIINRLKLIQNVKGNNVACYWNIYKYLQVGTTTYGNNISSDRALNYEILQRLSCVSKLATRSQGGKIHNRLHIFNWFFIETLGYFSFLGVLLIQTQSYQMQLSMCIITVVSISLLCYAVSDMDSPFHGFIRVDLDGLVDTVHMLDTMARNVCLNSLGKNKISKA